MMVKTGRKLIPVFVSLIATAWLLAGCGGGGGGTAGPTRGDMNLRVEFPASDLDLGSETFDAVIDVLSYNDLGVSTSQASSEFTVTCSEGRCVGAAALQHIPAGDNYICKISAYYKETNTSLRTAANGQTAIFRIGALVDSIGNGNTSDVTVNTVSTVAALSILRYAMTKETDLGDTEIITKAVKDKIRAAAATLVASEEFEASVFTSGMSDMFVVDDWTEAFLNYADAVIREANLGPGVKEFIPADGDENVPFERPEFKVVFTDAMDADIDFNDPGTLSDSGFEIEIQRDGGGTITIDADNALDYGEFAWVKTTVTNDTLRFKLKSSETLEANSLNALKPGTTYNILSRTVPTNLTDAAGNALIWTETDIPSTGSFTTTNDTTSPEVDYIIPADGDEDVPYNETEFSVVFTESMEPVDLMYGNALNDLGLSIGISRQGGGSTEINSANALNYGYFEWTTTTVANDTLVFTLYPNYALEANLLFTLKPNSIYTIGWDLADEGVLTDVAGNPLVTTDVPMTGTFTTTSDVTPPEVAYFSPTDGDIDVPYDETEFKVVFTESMNPVDMSSNGTTLDALGLTIAICRSGGGCTEINSGNALDYGWFTWSTTASANDTLVFTLYDVTILVANSLYTLKPDSTYSSDWTIENPSVLTDLADNSLITTDVPTVGSFMTATYAP
jgi:hypothetical protein